MLCVFTRVGKVSSLFVFQGEEGKHCSLYFIEAYISKHFGAHKPMYGKALVEGGFAFTKVLVDISLVTI